MCFNVFASQQINILNSIIHINYSTQYDIQPLNHCSTAFNFIKTILYKNDNHIIIHEIVSIMLFIWEQRTRKAVIFSLKPSSEL